MRGVGAEKTSVFPRPGLLQHLARMAPQDLQRRLDERSSRRVHPAADGFPYLPHGMESAADTFRS